LITCWVLTHLDHRLEKLRAKRSSSLNKKDPKKDDEPNPDTDNDELYVERIRLENSKLRLSSVSLACYDLLSTQTFAILYIYMIMAFVLMDSALRVF